MRTILLSGLLLAAASTLVLADAPVPPKNATVSRTPMRLTVSSAAFADGDEIPSAYACDGADIAPPLAWTDAPKDTRSIALLVEDPDASRGTFTHWLVTDLPPRTSSLLDGVLPRGAAATKNDKGVVGYSGPCPPSGRHHYHFRVYALDQTLATPANRSDLLTAIKGHVLAEGELVGTYQKAARR